MPNISKAQQKCVQRYVSNHYDRAVLTMPQGKRDEIKAAAKAVGESMNTFINKAIDMRMQKQGKV